MRTTATQNDMNVLSIEASGAQMGLTALHYAVTENGEASSQVVASFVSHEPRSLSRELVMHVDNILSSASWRLADLDVIAVGIGPGSWTSLRIALATSKTLAQASAIDLCGIPTFDAWAHAAARVTGTQHNTLILATARCRPGEIYGKLFAFEYSNEKLQTRVIIAEEVHSPTVWCELVAQVKNDNAQLIVCGEASESVMQVTAAGQLQPSFIDVSIADVAFQIARLGAEKAARGESDDALFLQPLYIGVSNAERSLQEKQLLEKQLL